jgi:hypothetical protein
MIALFLPAHRTHLKLGQVRLIENIIPNLAINLAWKSANKRKKLYIGLLTNQAIQISNLYFQIFLRTFLLIYSIPKDFYNFKSVFLSDGILFKKVSFFI